MAALFTDAGDESVFGDDYAQIITEIGDVCQGKGIVLSGLLPIWSDTKEDLSTLMKSLTDSGVQRSVFNFVHLTHLVRLLYTCRSDFNAASPLRFVLTFDPRAYDGNTHKAWPDRTVGVPTSGSCIFPITSSVRHFASSSIKGELFSLMEKQVCAVCGANIDSFLIYCRRLSLRHHTFEHQAQARPAFHGKFSDELSRYLLFLSRPAT